MVFFSSVTDTLSPHVGGEGEKEHVLAATPNYSVDGREPRNRWRCAGKRRRCPV